MMSMDALPAVETVLDLDLMDALPSPALRAAAAAARLRLVAKGVRIFDQGEPAARAHGLASGCVRISQAGSDGEEILVRLIGPGEIFGSATIRTDQRYPADATTLTDAVEVSWEQGELLALMRHHPEIAINMIAIIGRRLGEAQERLRELATQSVDRRIARTLLRLLHQTRHAAGAGFRIGFPLRRKDIADIAGTTLHTASRILADWERQGLLVSRSRHLTICSPESIRRIAEGASP